MSSEKKRVRAAFRDSVFLRDGNKCRKCGDTKGPLDAHHITDRNQMPEGGYVAENGISLCPPCHELAEIFHSTGQAYSNFSPEDLYRDIGSSEARAREACARLGTRSR